MVIGHEISGTVSKLGYGVEGLNVGDRVAIDPCRPCGQCRQCLKGQSNLCVNMTLSGVIKCDGGFANYMTTPAWTCHKLPDNVSLEEGAMMEPLSVGVNAVRRAKMEQGDSVIVIGAGPVGLFTMQCAKALGARKVMMVDVNDARLEFAKKLGVDLTFNPPRTNDPKVAGQALVAALGEEADICIECSGAKGTVDAAIHACRPGGTVMMVGFGDMAFHAHIGMAAVREIDILGAFANVNNYPECIKLVSSGAVDVKSAISHRLTLDNVKDGMDLIRKGQSIKVVIDCES